jgi:copper chaperone CopZ
MIFCALITLNVSEIYKAPSTIPYQLATFLLFIILALYLNRSQQFMRLSNISFSNILLFFCFTSAFSQLISQQDAKIISQPEELGKVEWHRDYDKAVLAAQNEKKDIVILFQEVPGCATCRNYGHNVLSHPLMTEALENEFIPLAIFNNKSGKDKLILDKFNEPSWNNPVVRIIDAAGKDLVQRISNDYSALTLCERLKEALKRRKTDIPEYMNILEQELAALQFNRSNELYCKMYCFWTGEKELGNLDGVLNVQAGFMGRSEVVKVSYDNTVLSEKELIDYGKKKNIEPVNKNRAQAFKIASNDVRYYLQQSAYKYLPLSDLQKTKINSALGNFQNAEKYLSPSQKKWLMDLKQNPKVKRSALFTKVLVEAWHLIE